MGKKYLKAQEGLSLIEALIAISLFLVVFTTFLIASTTANRYIRETTQRLSAIYLCQEKIEEYKAMDYRYVPVGTLPRDGPEDVVIDELVDLDSEDDDLTGERVTFIEEEWDIDGNDDDPEEGKIITVTVSWTTVSGTHQQELRTGRCNPY